MKKIILTLLIVFCCATTLFSTQKAHAQNYPNSLAWKELDKADAESGIIGALNKLTELKEPEESMQASFWFRNRAIKTYFDPDYTAAYARVVWAIGMKDDASLYALMAIMTATIDSYQCSDRSAYGVLALQYKAAFQDMLKHLKSLPKDTREENEGIAKRMVSIRYFGGKKEVPFASKIIPNTKQPHICSYGSKAMVEALVNKNATIKDAGKGELGEKQYAVDLSGYVPSVVSLEEWETKARKALEK